jgi:hypothetical protein
MVGTVSDSPDELSYNKNTTNVKGYNFSEALAQAIAFVDAQSLTIPNAIKLAIDSISNKSPYFKLKWYQGNDMTTVTNKPKETWFYWTLNKILEKYSTNAATGVGDYFWYVDNDNYLHWFHADSVGSSTFSTVTTPYRSIKTGKDKAGIINYIILKGGLDPAGKPIQTYVANYPSIAKNGMKFHILVGGNADAGTLVKQDLGNTSNSTTFPLAYPFTTTWKYSGVSVKVVETITMTPGNTVTVTTDKQYTGVIKEEILQRLLKSGNDMLQAYQYGKLSVDVSFTPGQITWGLGDKILCTIPMIDSGNKTLRVTEIQYTTDNDMYSLVEDVGSI